MPRASQKVNHFLAFPLRQRDTLHDGTQPRAEIIESDMGRVAATIWDMLRYDACYPVSNTPAGWVVVCQPYRDGFKGGFTIARWESFSIRGILTVTGPVNYGTQIPLELSDRMRYVEEQRTKAKEMGVKV